MNTANTDKDLHMAAVSGAAAIPYCIYLEMPVR
jgi:hypothetical protein